MSEGIKLAVPDKITAEVLSKCTCHIYEWSANPCPYYADQLNHENSQCNCCPYCYNKCADSSKNKRLASR